MDEALRRARRAYLASQDPVSAANYIAALERSAGLQAPHQYEIQNTLIVSSSHIDIDDSDFLNSEAGPVWAAYPHGWILWIPTPVELFQGYVVQYPDNIANLMRLAKSLDCEFLKIDSDGPVYQGLPVFDW